MQLVWCSVCGYEDDTGSFDKCWCDIFKDLPDDGGIVVVKDTNDEILIIEDDPGDLVELPTGIGMAEMGRMVAEAVVNAVVGRKQ